MQAFFFFSFFLVPLGAQNEAVNPKCAVKRFLSQDKFGFQCAQTFLISFGNGSCDMIWISLFFVTEIATTIIVFFDFQRVVRDDKIICFVGEAVFFFVFQLKLIG